MRPSLIKPGMFAASRNPFAGFEDLNVTSDDPNDPRFTGGGGREDDDDTDDDDEDDEDEDDDEEDDPKFKKRTSSKKTKKDDEDDEDDDPRVHRAAQQAKRYRLALRAKEKELETVNARLQALEDVDKAPDEVATREITTLRNEKTALVEQNRTMMAQLAFFKTTIPGVEWIDAADVFALADRSGLFDDVIDEDGTIDERELRRGLKELAKRKPHLVKKLEDDEKARGRKSTKDDEDEEEDDDEEPRSARRSGSTMNGKRKGTKGTADRAALAKKFPVLGQF